MEMQESGTDTKLEAGNADAGETNAAPSANPNGVSNAQNGATGVNRGVFNFFGQPGSPIADRPRLGFTEAEERRLEEASKPGYQPPPPPPRSLPVSEHLRQVGTVVQRARDVGKAWVTSAEVNTVLIHAGLRQPGSSANSIGDALGMKGLRLQQAPAPGGGTQYKVPDCDVAEHMRKLGYDI